eukprot:CAMPEP_0119388196 /NCGR_PEP_ID=MMETSP1334-20130426/103939_1 /TAXON_ID=127549 /ORGANISM="Calcidiscus leptoporus, Strain RCC1130" /LENGTH=341 /DNA_ID=CAMNT_0007410111 /DNA_START=191 /DNA_END=1216 /DNA_ORIENTATION=-
MGIWSWDIIGCDATLELAMDLLTCAGVGPPDYATRRKSFKLVFSVCATKNGEDGHWIGRHTPDEYLEFFACLDASAAQYVALDAALAEMISMANSVQTVFDLAGGGDTPVGHAFQVLGLLLMQAGALPVEVADVLLAMPACAASNPGEHDERTSHEDRFKAAIREYNAALETKHDVFLYHRLATAPGTLPHVHIQLETFPVFRGQKVKYRPRSWDKQMFFLEDGDVPATVTKTPFGFRASDTGKATMRAVNQGDPEMAVIAAQGQVDRVKLNAAYTRNDDECMANKSLMGKRVRLHSLVKQPNHNGRVGTVVAYNNSANRYAVEVDGIGRMALKEANLVVI